MLDGVAQGAEFAEIVRGYVERATAPLLARIADLEAREPLPSVAGPAGRDGLDGKDGESVTLEHVAPLVDEAVSRAVAQVPTPTDGRDGVDGKDAEPVTREQIIAAILAMPDVLEVAVARHLEANPPAAGRDGTDGQDGRDGIDGAKGEPGRDGADGQDGAAAPVVAGAIKDHTGELVLTLTDGLLLRTGIFDGAPGQDGASGQDGRDGLGFDNMVEELAADGRSVVRRYMRGDEMREFVFPLPGIFDCGVYKAGESYQRGDAVTWGGSLWIAQRQTADKPETSDAWRLSVKRGRDGKDGAPGAKGLDGMEGPQGPPGRDRG